MEVDLCSGDEEHIQLCLVNEGTGELHRAYCSPVMVEVHYIETQCILIYKDHLWRQLTKARDGKTAMK